MAGQLGIEYELIRHTRDGSRSGDASAALRGQTGLVIKLLILENATEQIAVAGILLGSDRLDVHALERIVDVKKLRFASGERVEELTGFEPGGVPPFATLNCNKIVISRNVLAVREVIGAGGHRFCGARLAPQELLKVPGTVVGDIARRG